MDYKKPVMLAKSEPKRTFVAGCPTNDRGHDWSVSGQVHGCMNCERTR